MIKNGERKLAYITVIDEIKPIPNADKIELARVGGWQVVVSKADNYKVGDKVIYIEIDSRVPSDKECFAFLQDRKYKVKCGICVFFSRTWKMGRYFKFAW